MKTTTTTNAIPAVLLHGRTGQILDDGIEIEPGATIRRPSLRTLRALPVAARDYAANVYGPLVEANDGNGWYLAAARIPEHLLRQIT